MERPCPPPSVSVLNIIVKPKSPHYLGSADFVDNHTKCVCTARDSLRAIALNMRLTVRRILMESMSPCDLFLEDTYAAYDSRYTDLGLLG